jgi:betaine-aldehyde dehydrogenase
MPIVEVRMPSGTIFADVPQESRIFLEEIFGPVLTVSTFESEEEAVELTNHTSHGLAKGFWTKDVDKVHRVSRRLRSGTVYVNTFLETAIQLPFGGYKQSRLGRELGLEGLLEFTETKLTYTKLGACASISAHDHLTVGYKPFLFDPGEDASS